VKTPVNDSPRFGLYMTHGKMEVTDKRLASEMLQGKLLEASPDVFTVAQTAKNLRFEFKPQFDALIEGAVNSLRR
jgi:hypothetical protein